MLRRSQEEIEYAFETFAAGCDIIVKGYTREKFPTLPLEGVSIVPGRVYWKLVRGPVNVPQSGFSHCSVFGFVRKSDGAIFKAASWKAPFVKGPSAIRGYVTDPNNGLSSITVYGVVYAK